MSNVYNFNEWSARINEQAEDGSKTATGNIAVFLMGSQQYPTQKALSRSSVLYDVKKGKDEAVVMFYKEVPGQSRTVNAVDFVHGKNNTSLTKNILMGIENTQNPRYIAIGNLVTGPVKSRTVGAKTLVVFTLRGEDANTAIANVQSSTSIPNTMIDFVKLLVNKLSYVEGQYDEVVIKQLTAKAIESKFVNNDLDEKQKMNYSARSNEEIKSSLDIKSIMIQNKG